MINQMTKRLILKDWYLSRHFLVLYVFGGLAGILMSIYGGNLGLLIGGILLVSMMMGVGIHLVFSTIINERKLQTLPFIMSLPISIKDYTLSKIIANVTAFLVPWLLLSIVALVAVYRWLDIPNGYIPLLTVMLLELVVAYFILLGTALLTESEPWTIAVMSVLNSLFGVIFYILGDMESIQKHVFGPTPVWDTTIFILWAVEFAVIAIVFALIFHFQSKKTDFL